jgi:hypothetical protein
VRLEAVIVDSSDRPTLTIGTFARRSRLSAKALRLYDRLGVLAPAEVDGHSGYRLYQESQLATARLVDVINTYWARLRVDPPLSAISST